MCDLPMMLSCRLGRLRLRQVYGMHRLLTDLQLLLKVHAGNEQLRDLARMGMGFLKYTTKTKPAATSEATTTIAAANRHNEMATKATKATPAANNKINTCGVMRMNCLDLSNLAKSTTCLMATLRLMASMNTSNSSITLNIEETIENLHEYAFIRIVLSSSLETSLNRTVNVYEHQSELVTREDGQLDTGASFTNAPYDQSQSQQDANFFRCDTGATPSSTDTLQSKIQQVCDIRQDIKHHLDMNIQHYYGGSKNTDDQLPVSTIDTRPLKQNPR